MPDQLTGLPTPREGLRDALAPRAVSCCWIDIDGLIWLNDQFGHATGDVALVRVADHLRANSHALRVTVYRIGGDEFLLLFPRSTGDSAVLRHATRIVDSIRGLKLPYLRPSRPDRTVLEVNIAVFRADNDFAERCLTGSGVTTSARDWMEKHIYNEKKRLGREAGVVVDILDARGAPWHLASPTT